MVNGVSPNIVEQWLKGWSLSRELPLPVKFESGFKVDVGYEKQKVRYVFPVLNDDFIQLSNRIAEPWIFLKVCARPEDVKHRISEKWIIQPQGYMMSCFHSMNIPNVNLHDGYKLEFDHYNSTFVVRIVSPKGELTSTGRIVLVGDLAVYDRVSTGSTHRRKGLATFLMKELEKIASSKGVFKGFLVATEEGKSLYESLGWQFYSLYTSAVISI
jgi:GNAT superfamily N-acetyltransferase